MTISNHITLADIHRMPVGKIAALPADQLAPLKGAADERLTQAKSVADWLDGAISLKYADRARDTRQEAGKDTGTIRLEDDGVTLIAELPKRIDWDQALLAQNELQEPPHLGQLIERSASPRRSMRARS